MLNCDSSGSKVGALLSDEYVIKVLSATYERPLSVQEISIRFEIPIASCYRRIHELEKAGLVKCTSRILTRKGKRLKLYSSNISGIYLFFDKGKAKIKLNPRPKDIICRCENLVNE